MTNPWFRFYSEFSHDPKVQMMSEAMQRRYIMIMCLRCSNDLVTLHETEIAFHLRITDEELAETKALFIAKGFIDDKWNLLNWDKRQFKSDSSAERVARHRENKKKAGNADVTLQQRQSNALDTDKDTDKEERKPLSALPAKTDPAPSRLNGKTQMVSEVMAYLNLQARRNYRVSNPNGTPTAGALVIAQRLKEGYTVEQCKDVIGVKSNTWMGDEKMDQYLNPQTLFRKSNFDKYLTEAEAQQ